MISVSMFVFPLFRESMQAGMDQHQAEVRQAEQPDPLRESDGGGDLDAP